MLVVELSWGRKFFQTYWRELRVWSPGSACRSVYNIDKSYDLYLNLLAIRKDGSTQEVHRHHGQPASSGFLLDGRRDWPEHSTLKIRLEPVANKPTADIPSPSISGPHYGRSRAANPRRRARGAPAFS